MIDIQHVLSIYLITFIGAMIILAWPDDPGDN